MDEWDEVIRYYQNRARIGDPGWEEQDELTRQVWRLRYLYDGTTGPRKLRKLLTRHLNPGADLTKWSHLGEDERAAWDCRWILLNECLDPGSQLYLMVDDGREVKLGVGVTRQYAAKAA